MNYSTNLLLANSTPDFLQIFTKRLQKSQKSFYLLCSSKEESRTVNYGARQYKGRRKLKGPRRPTEPSDILDFEKTAQLRQQTYFFKPLPPSPRFINTTQEVFIVAGQPSVSDNIRKKLFKERLCCRLQELYLPLLTVLLLSEYHEIL